MNKHELTLYGGTKDAVRIPADLLAESIAALLDGARHAVRYAVEGMSARKGPRPGWVDRACAVEVTGLRKGSAVIALEAPTLGEADSDRFGDDRQGELFEDGRSVIRGRTAVELFGEVLVDGLSGNADKVRADRMMLETCIRFLRVARGDYTAVEIGGLRGPQPSVRLESADIRKFESLRDATPPPEAARVCGTLDTISASRPDVILKLTDGTDLRVRLEGAAADLRESLYKVRVVISGIASYLPSGRIGTLNAEMIAEARAADEMFDALPKVRPSWTVSRVGLSEEEPALKAFLGSWPGEETDEELLAMLREVRR